MGEKAILIQGAMDIELKYLKEQLEDQEEVNIYGFNFLRGTIQKYPVVISKTNIGIINSSISTVLGILNFSPKYIINQGTGGALDNKIHKLDLVIGTTCKNINSYETKKRKKGEGSNSLEWDLITFCSEDEPEEKSIKGERFADSELIKLINKNKEFYQSGNVFFGKIGSGDIWNKEIDRIVQLNKMENILCEDMESIGAYTVANKFNVPVVGIRVMSDNELLEEEYDRTSAYIAQKFTLDIVKEIIRRQM